MKSRGSYYYLEHHTFTSQNNKVCAIIITRCFFCGWSGGLKSSRELMYYRLQLSQGKIVVKLTAYSDPPTSFTNFNKLTM